MTTATILADAFSLHLDRLASEGVQALQNTLERIKAAHPNLMKSIYDCPRYREVWRATLYPLCTNKSGAYELDMDRAQAWAQAWAQAEITAAAEKISAKVGNLIRPKVKGSPESGRFTLIGGHPNGSFVRVEQTRILNVSGKGLLYNQWPALIYVDNRRVSEAAYKRISLCPEDRTLPELGE